MVFSLKAVVGLLVVASSCVDALPFTLGSLNFLSRRAVIDHDAVVGFAQAVPSGTEGDLMLKYKPWLKVFNGCVPFPAVDAEGNTGGGLATTGSSDGDCSSSIGQVYARAGNYSGAYAIMYSFYMPKDSPSDGLGHRHDWENIIVWLSDATEDATLNGVAISAHGGYAEHTSPSLDGTRPKIGYISYWPLDHQLIGTDVQGGEQPLIAWESMTDAARSAIENTDFGAATPSFRDDNFQSYLAKGAL